MGGAIMIIVADFDGTVANTFAPSPNKIGVKEVYQKAIKLMFGDRGIEIYRKIGELKNRAPIGLIEDMLKADKSLITLAKAYFEKSFNPGNSPTLSWDENDLEFVIAEMLVRLRLSFLMKEIGPYWPKPCAGFLDFLARVKELRQAGFKLELVILSSGHESFIKKTFGVWGVECPRVLLTDDDVRGLAVEVGKKIKPSPFLFRLLYEKWLKEKNNQPGFASVDYKEFCQRAIYFGDDLTKDGKLAEAVGIPFGLFNPAGKEVYHLTENFFSFADWKVIADYLFLAAVGQPNWLIKFFPRR